MPEPGAPTSIVIRPALPSDVRAIRDIVQPYADRRILLPKELVGYFEAVQEFVVAEAVPVAGSDAADGGEVVGAGALHLVPAPTPREGDGTHDDGPAGGTGAAGAGTAAAPVSRAGALHVMWEDLAGVRTLAVHEEWRGRGVGRALLKELLDRARRLGLSRVFCLTFEVEFFSRYGFEPIEGSVVPPDVYAELLRSPDDGVAEFLDLARVKPNTLGNTRMLLHL